MSDSSFDGDYESSAMTYDLTSNCPTTDNGGSDTSSPPEPSLENSTVDGIDAREWKLSDYVLWLEKRGEEYDNGMDRLSILWKMA